MALPWIGFGGLGLYRFVMFHVHGRIPESRYYSSGNHICQ